MPYILLMIGAVLGYLDYMGVQNLLAAGSLLRQETFGYNPPFYKWLGALILVGLIGYVDELRPIATAMLILIILAIVLTKNRPSVAGQIINTL